MILRTITLENFGLYSGRQTLDLVPGRDAERDRPVVLVGGKNGAGKTTLLEAVRLALYGKRALGTRVGQAEYERHLASRVHVAADGTTPEHAAVGLEFDYAEAGVIHRYRVERRWPSRGSKVTDTLDLYKDGELVSSVPPEEWAQFLQDLVPPGVSQFFFFDGEKIAEIAHDGSHEGLAEAVRGLLGIELVGRLRVDLALYLARHSRKGDSGAARRLETAEREHQSLRRDVDQMAQDLADLEAAAAKATDHAADTRRRYFAEGGDAATRRGQLEAGRDDAKAQLDRRTAELRELAGGLLPLAVAPRLLSRIGHALGASTDATATKEAEALRERLLAWRAIGEPEREAAWKPGHWRDIERFLASEATRPTAAGSVLKSLPIADRHALLDALGQVRDAVAPQAALLAAEIEAQTERLAAIEADLQRARGHGAGMLSQELALADREAESAEAAVRTKAEEFKQLEFRRLTAERTLDKLTRAQNEAKAADGRATLAQRVGVALEQYEERLLEQKLAQLQAAFVSRFNHLSRKDDFIADARIDRSTFETTLIDRSGREIPKSSLSAGEKQVYAIAMLWALARTSGRPLPMIIDTPLARLDLDHRTALVERYFPEASHQVIVLSTDTEIDGPLLRKLGASVSHAYRLDYDPEQRATSVAAGYFAEGRKGEVRALHKT
ncbi:MAG: DNA sulfur modification protein DndD [Sphingomonas sp.]|uniref:DNA sulfur modification protein DndD n=1 Tax=Sphingomonas sp. TaxID=28214 RepID=UPI0011F9B43A|nr:DNA sulfur modification protein DndD [Sphingomonas sp.]THD34466.1 MAG: DNA sulfur modification protein DndD [Sphingomonas sp.]